MKILQVVPYFCFGGAETMCENLTYAQRSLGHEVVVVSLYDEQTPIARRMEAAGVRILYLDKKLGMDVSMVPKLLKILKQEKPDAVHTHLDVVKHAALAAKLAGVKTCVHTVHNVAQKEAAGLARKINRVWCRLGWARPVALSPEVQQTIGDTYGLEPEKIPVVFNGIDLSRCCPKETYAAGEEICLLHIGRFNEQKNHRRILEAFHMLTGEIPNCRLWLVGDGELMEATRSYARELGVEERVEFLGSQSNVYGFLQDADIFLMPSDYEGMPMTIIEAMGTGLPVVATAVGGVPDMLKDGESGLLVPCDARAVKDACKALARDESLRRKLGQAAQKDSLRFSAEEMARRYCAIYQN